MTHGDTHLTRSFKQTKNKYSREASVDGEDGSQQCQHCRPADSEQHQHFSADDLRQRSSKDLSRRVTVVECSENKALCLLIPLEYSRL